MTSNPARLLRIDASARTDHASVSRRLASRYEGHWHKRHPDGQILTRDLAVQAPPHIDDLTIKGYYTDPREMTPALRSATALSDALIGELKSATTLLIATPIYNFSIPSSLKAWIDQVVRIGQTFSYQNGQFEGLVRGADAVLVLAYGAGGYTGPLQSMDHLRPYLVSLLHFIGIAHVEVVMAEATTADEHTVAENMTAARKAIDDLLEAEITDNAVS
jgi:FMN-dependent NADH-azoreductase